MKIQINLEAQGQLGIDIGLLMEYGFDFEKNIETMIHDVAKQLRKAKNEQRTHGKID